MISIARLLLGKEEGAILCVLASGQPAKGKAEASFNFQRINNAAYKLLSLASPLLSL